MNRQQSGMQDAGLLFGKFNATLAPLPRSLTKELGMGVELWFLLTLAIVQLYERRAGKDFERLITRKLGIGSALMWLLLIAAAAFLFQKFNVGEMVSGRLITGGLVLALGGCISFTMCWLGLRYWLKKPWWNVASIILSLALTGGFLFRHPLLRRETVNNTLLVFFALGLACYVGHWVTVRFAYFFYAVLFFFDIYAVWFSRMMERMIDHIPNVVPTGFFIMGMSDYKSFLGAGDVIFAATGAVIIASHTSWRWAAVACVLYGAPVVLLSWDTFYRILPFSLYRFFILFPVMVTICPTTIGILALARSWRKKHCK